jgi:hypothetical protein
MVMMTSARLMITVTVTRTDDALLAVINSFFILIMGFFIVTSLYAHHLSTESNHGVVCNLGSETNKPD